MTSQLSKTEDSATAGSQQDTPSAALAVPDEPGVYWCGRHRKVKTRLRCGRCERPICTRCTVMAPTGARCPDCASNRSSHIYAVTQAQYGIAFVISAFMGALLAIVAGFVGLLTVFYAPAVGTLIGRAVVAATHGKRGTGLAVASSAGMALGALVQGGAVALVPLLLQGGLGQPISVAGMALTGLANPYLWLFIVLAIPGISWWLK